VTAPDRPTSFTAPPTPAERARFTRRQEALTISWLRALGRTSSTSKPTAPPAPEQARREPRG
jgi:hypothetical protein